jgi:hypothetical protein
MVVAGDRQAAAQDGKMAEMARQERADGCEPEPSDRRRGGDRQRWRRRARGAGGRGRSGAGQGVPLEAAERFSGGVARAPRPRPQGQMARKGRVGRGGAGADAAAVASSGAGARASRVPGHREAGASERRGADSRAAEAPVKAIGRRDVPSRSRATVQVSVANDYEDEPGLLRLLEGRRTTPSGPFRCWPADPRSTCSG